MLAVAEKVETPPEDRVVCRLALVVADRGQLLSTVNGEFKIDLVACTADELGLELVIEGFGDSCWQCPCQNGEVECDRCLDGRVGGALMVCVSGDATVVEHQQGVCVDEFFELLDVFGELVKGQIVEFAIGVVE